MSKTTGACNRAAHSGSMDLAKLKPNAFWWPLTSLQAEFPLTIALGGYSTFSTLKKTALHFFRKQRVLIDTFALFWEDTAYRYWFGRSSHCADSS